jgi:hypothetical protein
MLNKILKIVEERELKMNHEFPPFSGVSSYNKISYADYKLEEILDSQQS